MRNSIVYGNTKGTGYSVSNVNSSVAAIYANTLVEGATLNAGIISNADPLFADADNGDYRLQSFSPAINIGVDSMYQNGGSLDGVNTDLAGGPRIQDCNVDLGAYETSSGIKPAAGRVYVRTGGKGDGSSWTNAYPNLAVPLYLAQKCDITEIWVAAGVYRPEFMPIYTTTLTNPDKTFLLVEGVKIYGGFTDDTLSSSPVPLHAFGSAGRDGVSVLSGDIGKANDSTDNVHHVVLGVGTLTAATVLDGFTVTGGYADPNISTYFPVNGVNVYRRNGGGISLYSSTSSPVLSNLVVSGNTAYNGGICNFGKPALTNVLISGNIATAIAGGIYNINVESSLMMTNVTVAGNHASGSGGIYFDNTSRQQMRNSIVYGNTAGTNKTVSNVNNFNAAIYANTLVGGTTLNAGIISNADPLFVNAAGGDYRLQSLSPAIDMGVDSMYLSGGSLYGVNTDLAGDIRIQGCNVDLGAYETSSCIKPASGRVYVRRGGAGDGSSWTNAYPDLAVPLYLAKKCGITEIWVAAGVYHPEFALPSTTNQTNRDKTFLLVEGVKIYGGFTDDTLSSNPVPPLHAFGSAGRDGVSVLSGDIGDIGAANNADNVHHVVLGVGALTAATVLDGFTVTGGYADLNSSFSVDGVTIYRRYGGGISLYSSASPVLSNLVVSGNTAYYGGGIYNSDSSPALTNVIISDNITTSNGYGGGIYNSGSSPVLTKVIISDNITTGNGYGGGIYNISSSPVMTDVQITNNTAYDGGGIYNSGSLPVITDGQITGNTATRYGGGIYNTGSSPSLTNVLISDNIATSNGGGIYNTGSSSLPLMTNVTVAGNHANSSYGGIYFYNTSTQQMRNSIVYGNTAGTNNTVSNVSSSTAAIYANTLAGGTTLNAGIISNADPMFVDADNGDYRLKSPSPAIDMGVDSMYLSGGSLYGINTDLAGNSRIQGCNVDLGAYETSFSLNPDAGRVYVRRGGAGDGSSWADAYPDLAVPLYLAQKCGISEIWVAAGVYRPEFAPPITGTTSLTNRDKTFLLVEGVKIYGGFTDDTLTLSLYMLSAAQA
jgi:hypothetical protein